MTTTRTPLAVLLTVAVSLSVAPLSAAAPLDRAQGHDDAPVTIRDGDLTMNPGDFDALRYDVTDGTDIDSVTWSVDSDPGSSSVVEVDASTGRIDALGVGEATVSLSATGAEGQSWQASAEVSVEPGPDPIVEPVAALQDGNRPDFMVGADVSSAWQMMQQGKKYYDLDGNEAHLFDILADQGVNWVRLRVWNDPEDPFGNPYGGGNSTLDTTIALAQQAKQRGMKINVVFHYSDFWVHPGQQVRPKAWSDLTGQDLADAVGAFTAESLTTMGEAGVYPNMVTVGNETNSGIVDVNFGLDDAGYMHPTAVEVLKAGSAAVRSTDPNADDPQQRTLVSFHLANGNNTWLYSSFTRALDNNDVDYDALGASYYPSWHGTADQVRDNLDTITARYDKYAYIAETAYPWTINENAGDDTPQNFKHGDVSTVGLAASVQGQSTALRDSIEVAASIDDEKGLGAFYWEPAWLPGPTTGWVAPYGTGWEAAGVFDINGHALPSIRTFDLVRGEEEVPDDAEDWAYGWETTVTVDEGSTVSMPEEILAVKNNGRMGDSPRTIDRQPVSWDAHDVAAVDTTTPGEYIVFGSVGAGTDNAFAHVVVRASAGPSASAPTFSLPDGAEVAAVGNGYSYSARHVDPDAGGIELQTSTANAAIHLTLDGADVWTGAGSTRELVGAPWIRDIDSIRTYAGPIQISQNVEVQAVARRTGYDYVAGAWGSDRWLLDGSPVQTRSYKAVYDYDGHHLRNGGLEAGDLTGWDLAGDAGAVVQPEDYVTGAYAGDSSFAFSLEAGQSLSLGQDVLVPNGTYDLSLYARGDDQTDDATGMSLTAVSGGVEHSADVRTVRVPGGSMIWRQYTVEDVEVTDNEVSIVFDAGTEGSYSGIVDHVVLQDEAGLTTHQTLVALTQELLRANGANRGQVISLLSKLEAAERSRAAGNETAMQAQLTAYERQLRALTGRVLSSAEADELLRRSAAYRD